MRYKLQAKLSTVFLHPSVKLECLGDGLFVLCVVFFFPFFTLTVSEENNNLCLHYYDRKYWK